MFTVKSRILNINVFIALILSLFVTVSLIFTMHLLIRMAKPELKKSDTFVMPKFIHVPEPEQINTIKPPEKPLDVAEKPEVVNKNIKPSSDINKIDVVLNAAVSINKNNSIGLAPGDGEYLPIVKIAPVYPRRAAERCLEGYVVVSFTVTPNGSVENPEVIDSSSSLFHSSAKKAAAKFKYKPRTVDGVAVAVPNVTNKITYKMDGCR